MTATKESLLAQHPELAAAAAGNDCGWLNPKLVPYAQASLPLPVSTITDAEKRLERFAPYIQKQFPETAATGGLIESELREIPSMRARLNDKFAARIDGKLYLKMDSHLPIAGSIKARGGIYEILKYAETLALRRGVLREGDNYDVLAGKEAVALFNQHVIQVGSTGNLGLSIGIISAKLGFRVIVHMSADAKQWKKDLLRSKGVEVREYSSDYSEAVRLGRLESDKDPASYFVDDENSTDLFLGYAVAAGRLKAQLDAAGAKVDASHPLFVYLPCGIGGAPGGVTYGLKALFGDNVHCFFTEPTHACCMLFGMATGLHHQVSVQDFGIDGKTQADGLAVGRASSFVGKTMEPLLSGIFTVDDSRLFAWMRDLQESENIFIEPSACAAFASVLHPEIIQRYVKEHNLAAIADDSTHIAWATGGNMVPADARQQYQREF